MPRPVSLPLALTALTATGLLAACDPATPAPDAGPVDAGPVDAGPPPPAMPAARPLTQWVDPFLGTGGIGFNDIGSTYPGPAMPFGMIHPGPDTMDEGGAPVFTHCVGYAANDEYIRAFSAMRLHGVGIADQAVVGLMPTIGMSPARTTTLGHRSHFDDATEEASPGHYAVTLDEGSIRVELTAARRAAIHRYTFEPGADATVLLDVGHAITDVTIDDGAVTILPGAREIEGVVRFRGGYSGRFGGMSVYFVARFDRAPTASGVWKAGTLFEGETARTGPDVGAWVRFDATTDADVEVALGVSLVDVAGARANLDAEAGALDFDAMRAAAEAAWEAELGRLELEARDPRDLRLAYTALYHALLMPTLATDVDGRYRGLDGLVHTAEGFTYYTDFSLWDTYRTLHPLITLLDPARATDFARSLVAMAEQHGSYPRWPLGTGETFGMLGDPAVIVLADTWQRGVRGFDLAHAYALAQVSADGDPPSGGRGSMESYLRLGYCPIESGGSSVSRTLEFAYADAAMATMARALGRTDDAARYEARSQNFRHVWDESRGFFVGRGEDGAFQAAYAEDVWDDAYAEGNGWQYLWLAPQDPAGLASLMGGVEPCLARLGTFFENSVAERRTIGPPRWYWHGNEPDLHASFLFGALGDPDAAARWSTWARRTFYREGPRGLPGNDDGGTMSAWYLFASLGLYPLAGGDDYLVGSPLWPHAVVHLPGGDLEIDAPDASEAAIYVHALSIDGAPTDRVRVSHATLADGAVLHFDMAAAPERRAP